MRGNFDSRPVLTAEHDEQLINLAETFDRMPMSTQLERHSRNAVEDDYNAIGNIDELLESHGFKLLRREAGIGYWRKPNSSDPNQHHVTTNCGGTNKIRCFSSACDPFKILKVTLATVLDRLLLNMRATPNRGAGFRLPFEYPVEASD